MKKRGLSEIITVMLFILLSLVVLTVIWTFVSSYVSNQSNLLQIQNQVFSEQVNIAGVKFDPNNPLKVQLSLQKSSGSDITKNLTSSSHVVPPGVDVISDSDLSGSMRSCPGISSSCCSSLGGVGGSCSGIPSSNIDKCTPQCGGTTIDGLTPAQNATTQLIDNLFGSINKNKFGLVAYNYKVIPQYSLNLTDNSSELKTIVNSWQAGGSTCICCGINYAASELHNLSSQIPKTLIVMSDGAANYQCSQQGTGSPTKDAIKAACDAYANVPNLTIYSVGVGGAVDVSTLTSISQCGNGTYFSASNVSNLVGIYNVLASKIISNYVTLSQITYLKVIFYNGTNSIYETINTPKPLETQSYTFDLSGELVPPITKIEVYPVIKSGGKEIIGPLFASWTKPS